MLVREWAAYARVAVEHHGNEDEVAHARSAVRRSVRHANEWDSQPAEQIPDWATAETAAILEVPYILILTHMCVFKERIVKLTKLSLNTHMCVFKESFVKPAVQRCTVYAAPQA